MKFTDLKKNQQEAVNTALGISESLSFFARHKKEKLRDRSEYKITSIHKIEKQEDGTITVWESEDMGFDLYEAQGLVEGQEMILLHRIGRPKFEAVPIFVPREL